MSALVRVAVVGVGAFLLGALTYLAQGLLPDALSSLANSPSGWALLTVLLVVAVRPSLRWGAVCGLVAFVLLVLGYTAAAEVDGLAYDPVRWGAIGVVTGPFVGAAAAALRDPRGEARALGSALLAAIGIADAIYGLTVVRESTSPVYWWLVGALGIALLVVVGSRLGRARLVALQVGSCAVLVVGATLGYAAINALG